MNDLQKLLHLRGLSIAQLARDMGRGYHAVQKVIKGHYVGVELRKEIAEHLGLHYFEIWGDESRKAMRRIIREEINRRAEHERRRLRERFLSNGRRLADRKRAHNG